MKFAAFIMAVLVLVLSCMPCSDDSCDSRAFSSTAAYLQGLDHPAQDHEDACSPLCVCACCAALWVNPKPAEFPVFIRETAVAYSSSYTGLVINVSFSIWQPPRLIA